VAERRFIDDLKELSTSIGVPKERLTLHQFRHFFISECADHGVPMADGKRDRARIAQHGVARHETTWIINGSGSKKPCPRAGNGA
jgi:hypothetical protein